MHNKTESFSLLPLCSEVLLWATHLIYMVTVISSAFGLSENQGEILIPSAVYVSECFQNGILQLNGGDPSRIHWN